MADGPARTLDEATSSALLASAGVAVAPSRVVADVDAAVGAAHELGLPVVVKLCGDAIAHKTERGLVRLSLGDDAAVRRAATELLGAARPEDGEVSLLVAPMVSGTRELIAGLVDDPQFGMTVMLGIGGVLAEAVRDVTFRLVPLSEADAAEMIDDLSTQRLLGPFRGEPAIDRHAVAATMIALSHLATERTDLRSVDVNPLVVVDGAPIAVDALVEVATDEAIPPAHAAGPAPGAHLRPEHFDALFDPRGVVIAGAATHPGKFGFVSLHNLLASGYEGEVAATNLRGETVLGLETVPSIDDLPAGRFDLVVVCTPASANADVLRQAAGRGIKAAFITSAGYGEAGPQGRRAQDELVALGVELDLLVAGPNGQGVVSTPSRLCAQIVAPYPPAGRIGIASQSGNFVSSFQNWARGSGIGVSRAVSAGNAAMVGVVDYLAHYARDPETVVGLAYVESVPDGQTFAAAAAEISAQMPLVVVKGGATEGGAAAAASHTGALAADDVVFGGMCRQHGLTRASTVEEAFEAAATFATQPLPAGPRTVVMTTAGGWGVVTADAITRSELELVALPEDLRDAIDQLLPPRWSRANPVDLAGGETRDTIPAVLELIAGHDEVDAIVYLGIGIQSNQARLMREGHLFPDHGIERIVEYHERQDARFAEAAAEVSAAAGKPVLSATELAVADPDNPGPATVRATGRYCYPSADRAVTALEHLWRRARWARARGL